MRKKFVQIAATCLVAACLLAVVGTASDWFIPDDPPPDTSSPLPSEPPGGGYIPPMDPNANKKIMRVGLAFGSTALDGANLENYIGNGFAFGYYDGNDQFIQLASTGYTRISLTKTVNVYYGNYDGYLSYHDNIASNIAVGCYHLQLDGAYGSAYEAQWVADQYLNYGAFVACISGAYYVRIGNYETKMQAESAMYALAAQGLNTVVAGTSAYGINAVVTGTSTIVFQYDDFGGGTGLAVVPVSTDGSQCRTWFDGYTWFGGFRYERINGGDLVVTNFVGMEDYVNCVISREMSDAWPLEALKAQAVAARSYGVSLNRHAGYHFDLCNTSCCQAYWGTAKIGANTAQAVASTAGQYVWYNGSIAQAFYSASNGGASEDVSVIWGGNQAAYPYLRGVVDPFEATVSIPNYTYTKEYTPAEMASKLQSKGYNCNNIVSAYVSEYTASGNPKTITFVDSSGRSYTLNNRTVKSMLGLKSYRYDFGTGNKPTFYVNGTDSVSGMSGMYAIDSNGNLIPLTEGAYVITSSGVSQTPTGREPITGNGKIVLSGAGNGHNVGMSQHGARAMALQGYNYVQILTFYYSGVSVG